MKVALNNFRAFSATPDIEIRPITLLVGENSTGKTSLLAALRFAFELSRADANSFFNVFPFDLGPYEDIVHSNGPNGTTKRFSISIEKFVNPERDRSMPLSAKTDIRPTLVRGTFFFMSNFGDTILSSVRIQSDHGQMDIHVVDKQLKLSVSTDDTSFSVRHDKGRLFAESSQGSISLRSIIYFLYSIKFENEELEKSSERQRVLDHFLGLYDAFVSENHEVVAAPPVRSVPQKVYTSADQVRNDPTSPTPQDLSKIKRSDKKRWSEFNRYLNKFGRQAGLFSRFDIKKLTQQDSGPFQVKVTVRNRASAIADVGYGVSQSLPIFADIIQHRQSKTALLLQQPEVHLHPRAQAELGSIFAEHVSNNSRSIVVAETHSDFLIDRIRIAVRERVISAALVNIVFLEPLDDGVAVHQLGLDGEGNITGAPPSYRAFFIREQERVLGF